jgi:hypothetical protein
MTDNFARASCYILHIKLVDITLINQFYLDYGKTFPLYKKKNSTFFKKNYLLADKIIYSRIYGEGIHYGYDGW